MNPPELQESLRAYARSLGVDPDVLASHEPDWSPLLDVVAAAWLVDESIYDTEVCPRLGQECPALKELSSQPEVEPVPRMPGVWRVRDSVREQRAADWMARVGETAAQGFFTSLAKLWRSRAVVNGADPAIALYFDLRAGSQSAEEQLEAMFEESEKRFDLDRCRQLLLMAPSGGAGNAVMEPLRRRLAARSYFAQDWYKTTRYYRRESLHTRLESFIHDKDDTRWLLPVHAAGGTGKTMMLRACTARHLVPKGVPVARVDFDFVVWRHLELSPWLVLLPLAEQLAVEFQAPECFPTFFRHAESWRPWLDHAKQDALSNKHDPPQAKRDPAERKETSDKFASIFAEDLPANKPVVLIFDTTEEPYLHGTPPVDAAPAGFPRGPLPAVLELLERLQAFRPRLRVIFSGRYDLFARRATDGRERIPGLEASFGNVRRTALEVRGFSVDETRSYLRDSCHLKLATDVEKAIFEKACGAAEEGGESAGTQSVEISALPFDVALWAREAEEKPGLSAEDIRNAPGLHYPIERVVARIHSTSVQWLVRYAVVPQRLTEAFLKEVLLDPLREAALGSAESAWKDRGRAQLDERHPQWKDLQFWQAGVPVNETVDKLWKALMAYASGPEEGWLEVVSSSGSVPQIRFHPRMVGPLRHLLEEEEVWAKLQQRSAAYFLKRAADCKKSGRAGEWGAEAAMALFHAFQESPAAGAALWGTLREEAQGMPWQALTPLAEMIMGDAGFEPGEQRRPLCGRDGTRRVPPDVEQEAREAAVRSLLWQAALTRKADIRVQCRAKAERWRPAEIGESFAAACSSLQFADAVYNKLTPVPESFPPLESDWWKLATPDAALAIVSRGVAAYAAHSTDTEVVFDGLVRWSERFPQHLPCAAAAAVAARVAGGDGRIGAALGHWQTVLQGGATAWCQAAEWLQEDAEELQLGCGFECSDAARPDLAMEIGKGLAVHAIPRVRSMALVLQHFAALRMGKMSGPGGLKALGLARASLTTDESNPAGRGAADAAASLALLEGLTLLRSQDFAPALERLRDAQDHWLKREDYHLRNAAAVAQAFAMLECGDLREARIALEPVPRENTRVPRRFAFPWQVTSITAAVLLAHSRGEPLAEEWERARAALPDPLQGRRGPHARAELEAARLAAGHPVLTELHERLAALPDAATRAAALWPLKFAVTPAGISNPGGPFAGRDLFPAWLKDPHEVPEFQLPHLVSLAEYLRVNNRTREANRALSHVLRESTRLHLPWLWREAAEASERNGTKVRSGPPLMLDNEDPVMASPFAARLLLETAKRAYFRHQPAVWRRYLAQARRAPAYPTLQLSPHAVWLREFEAELALLDGTPEAAITSLHEAAAAWDDMEDTKHAEACRQRAAALRTGSSGSSPGGDSRLQEHMSGLLTLPPPLLQIAGKGSPQRAAAQFQPEGRHLQWTNLSDELPPWLLEEGQEALSRLHYHLGSERTFLFEAMGRILAQTRPPSQDGVEQPWPDFLRLYSEHSLVMALPWECVRLPGEERSLPFALCRRPQVNWPAGRLIRWVQNALNRLGTQPPLVEDGIVGPLTSGAVAAFWSAERGGDEPRLAEVLHRMAKSLAAQPVSPARSTVSVTSGTSLTGNPGNDLLHEMRAAFHRALPGGTDPPGSITPVPLVCFIGAVEEFTSSSETVLDTQGGPQSAASLARLLEHRESGRSKCVAVIQVPLSGRLSPQENERHLLRRNLFAHRLYSTGSVLAVIATAAPDQPNPGTAKRAAALAEIAARGGSLREAVRLLHETEGPLSPFGGPTTALWAPHPDLPLIP